MNNDAAGNQSNITIEKKPTTLPMMFKNYAKATTGKTPKTLLEYSEIVAEQFAKNPFKTTTTNNADYAVHPNN